MAEDLIESLSRIEELKVIARNSTLAMRGKDVRVVGEQLDVGSVVEGSVRRSGDQLRVTAQLIRVEDASHLWSAQFERRLDDVFSIQREIAKHVAEAVRTELGVRGTWSWLVDGRYTTSDVRAFELVTRATDLYLTGDEAATRQSIDLLRQALEIDPDYAHAHAMLGWAYVNLWFFGIGPVGENLAKAVASAERAVELDPKNGPARNLLARATMNQGDWDTAEARYRAALEDTPNVGPLHHGLAMLLVRTGRIDEALPHAQRAVALDPTYWAMHFVLGNVQLSARDFNAARESFERADEPGILFLAYSHQRIGDEERAAQALMGLSWLSGADAQAQSAFDEGGLEALYKVVLDEYVAQSGRACGQWPSIGLILMALANEPDRMFECLGEAIRRAAVELPIKVHPILDPYRDDPRFTAALLRMNLAD
jgi:Tfp pilus assembly protein PilF